MCNAYWLANRPAHLHFIIDAEGHDQLITQVFFDGDEWLETDVADGVRDSLVIKLDKKDYYTEGSLEFSLRPCKVLINTK
ncbi:hypothetical protein [Peribacillus simplex]|uniref:dioxygenase family protein n=1 Tax=Peribacillus simplex TaxID=1478 RepID=UPI003D04EA64